MIKKLYFIFIVLYTILLLYWMFFGFGRTANSEKSIQLVPFSTIYKMFLQIDNFKQFNINILGNIIVFIPYGFLGMISEKLKRAKLLFPIFILAISYIEFLQFWENKIKEAGTILIKKMIRLYSYKKSKEENILL